MHPLFIEAAFCVIYLFTEETADGNYKLLLYHDVYMSNNNFFNSSDRSRNARIIIKLFYIYFNNSRLFL